MPESANPFITTAELASRLGRTSVTTDAYATICCDAACDMVRTKAEQTFNRSTTVLTLDGTGTDAIVLPELPVSTVGTVGLIDNAGGTTSVTDYALNGHGVLLRTRGSVDEDVTAMPSWPLGRQNVQLTYVHGSGTVPTDVRMVALSIASRLYLQGDSMFETMGQQSIRYAVASTDFSTGESQILAKYRQLS